MSRASDPALGIRFVLLATLLFALQDGISKHLAENYPVPWFVMFRYWFFALFVLTLSARQSGGGGFSSRFRSWSSWPVST